MSSALSEIMPLLFNSSIYITGAQTGKIDEAAAIYLAFFSFCEQLRRSVNFGCPLL